MHDQWDPVVRISSKPQVGITADLMDRDLIITPDPYVMDYWDPDGEDQQ